MDTFQEAGLLADQADAETQAPSAPRTCCGTANRRSRRRWPAEWGAQGWMLSAPVARIWAGERDTETLIAGLDTQDAMLLRGLLAQL